MTSCANYDLKSHEASFFYFAATLVTASARTWTSNDGIALDADFISATDAQMTLKLLKSGKEVTIPLTRLSEADQKFVKEEAKPPEVERVALEGEYAHLITGDCVNAEYGNLPYSFYGGKALDGSSKVPLVISLHGKSSNNENGKQIGFARNFVNDSNYEERPCLVLAPLCYQPHGETGGGWDDAPGEETLSFVNFFLKKLPIID